jgi:hypothetical protein
MSFNNTTSNTSTMNTTTLNTATTLEQALQTLLQQASQAVLRATNSNAAVEELGGVQDNNRVFFPSTPTTQGSNDFIVEGSVESSNGVDYSSHRLANNLVQGMAQFGQGVIQGAMETPAPLLGIQAQTSTDGVLTPMTRLVAY